MVVSFPVVYINFPNDKVVSDYLPQHIDIQIKSKGFNLLVYQFKKTKEAVVIDFKDAKSFKIKNNFYLPINSTIDKIANQFNSNITVLKINPDTIYFTFNKKISKKVVVKVNQNVTFSGDYQLADSIKIIPGKVLISGADEAIDKIKFVETFPLTVTDLNKSTKVKLAIQKSGNMKFVEVSPSEVTAFIKVSKFAEANIELPIQIENLPQNYNLKIFPDKVTIKYQVSFENYEKIRASDFKIIVDYKTIDKVSNKIKIQLVKAPVFVKSIKFSPEKVEYILRK